MRRLALSFAFLAALAAPAAALAAHQAAGDGSLVVTHGSAPAGSPVVVLKITGTVIGEVDGGGKIVIDTGADLTVTPEVTGAGSVHQVSKDKDGSAQYWQTGVNDFKFRVVGGKGVWIQIYGSDVNLVALGKGWVKLQGSTDTPKRDGRYSLNGDDPKSLPGAQSDPLVFPAANG
jgi:hypothetical protein